MAAGLGSGGWGALDQPRLAYDLHRLGDGTFLFFFFQYFYVYVKPFGI